MPSPTASDHPHPTGHAWFRLFLGGSPRWYKIAVLAALAGNALTWAALHVTTPAAAGFLVGWLIVAEFIACLAMALQCYPLLPGGLLALEAMVLGLTTPERLYEETHRNLAVVLLLVFIVAGVGFLKQWLTVVFTRLLFLTRSKLVLSLVFLLAGAFLSAFLDALTVMAVVIAVCLGFWNAYHEYRSHAHGDEVELREFRAFLRNLVMHAAIGTALGGVMTVVGEPQNLLIAGALRRLFAATRPELAHRWSFVGFIARMAPITMPTLLAGMATTVLVERFRWFGYGAQLPERVRTLLMERAQREAASRSPSDRLRLWLQGTCAVALVLALTFHLAEVGIIGLFLIVVAASITGVADEHRIGERFSESLPFTALLVVFFAIVAVIGDQHLFEPIISRVLAEDPDRQLIGLYLSNAALSSISDNVFVASVFIGEASARYHAGLIAPEQLERLAVAINVGTNLPSVATPNGQAALLFLLTSPLAAPIRLGYLDMLGLAFPYAVALTATSLVLVWCCA